MLIGNVQFTKLAVNFQGVDFFKESLEESKLMLVC